MPSIDVRVRFQGLKALLVGAALGLYASGSAYAAFSPSSAPLLSSAIVPPNVMLLVDNSRSMNNLIRDPNFDQSVVQPQLYSCDNDKDCKSYTTQNMAGENVVLGTLGHGDCGSDSYYAFLRSYGFGPRERVCLKLPDPVGGEETRYSARYLSYLIDQMPRGSESRDYTDGRIPTDYRMNVARNVSTALVTSNRGVRIGLAAFNPIGNDRGPGGYIARAIADIQVTKNTLEAQANSNYNGLLNSIKGLSAVANTPLAETYYEITRYFRGMMPYEKYNPGGAVYESPIQYRCQRNFGVVVTDGLPTYDRDYPTTTAEDPALAGEFKLPNWDQVNNDGNNINGDGEGDTLYLDDLAKFAYDIDMRSDGKDATGESWDATDFRRQNLLTYTVGFTAANKMLSDAASYGHGKYYQANDSSSLTFALTQALNEINTQAGSGGGGITSSSTSYSGNFYYQSLYDPTDWSGTIRAYAFGSDGSLDTTLAPRWTTNSTMSATSTNGTFQSWNTASNTAIALAYGNFSPDQRSVIDKSLVGLTTRQTTGANLTGTNLIDWTKGVNANGLKVRTRLLGDVINSPVVLAAATDQTAADIKGDTSYSAYLSTKASKMVTSLLVNANDGLTNVIEASSGRRLFAYLPSTTLPYLYQVEDPTYVEGKAHKFLNDGQLSVFDAQIGSVWKTIAFGGVGGAAKAFYALQLFDNGSNTVKALWELRAPETPNTNNGFNDLGYAYAKVEVARLPDANKTWAAFISNGYGSNSGVAALYVVNVATGALIKKIVVDSTETDNGLSSVKLVVNASNVVQAAYGGDLKGRLWKFDLSSPSTSNWGLAFSGKPLFTAPGGVSQPITAPPMVTPNPTSGYMVYVGTGKFLENTDKTTSATQSFYGIWDAAGGTGNFNEANLQPQAITGTFDATGGTYLTVSQNRVDYTTKKGWYLPLRYNDTLVGERVINQAVYTRGRVVFTTAGVDTSDPCTSQGFGRLIELDGISGSMLAYPVIDTNGDGLVNGDDKVSAGLNFLSGIPTLNAVVSDTGSGSSVDTKVVNTSDAKVKSIRELGGTGGARRIMWRQVQ